MKYKAIIFDMDGTIIDTDHIWTAATRHVIEKRGVPYTQELSTTLHKLLNGLGMYESCVIVKDLIKTDDTVENIMKEKQVLIVTTSNIVETISLIIQKIDIYYQEKTSLIRHLL